MADEPEITINGRRLSVGEAMTVRVAVSGFVSDMSVPGALGDDDHGTTMARLYSENGNRVLGYMLTRN